MQGKLVSSSKSNDQVDPKKVQPLTVRWSNRGNGRHGEDENIKRV